MARSGGYTDRDRYTDRNFDAYDDSYEQEGYYEDGPYIDERYDEEYIDDRYDDDRYDEYTASLPPYEEDYPKSRRTSRTGSRSSSARKSSASGRRSASSQGSKKARSGGSRKRRRKKSGAGPVAVIVLMILILGGAFGGKVYLDKYSYSDERADLNDQYGIQGEDDMGIVWDDAYSNEMRAKMFDGQVYMKLDDVRANLNDRFYYGVENSSDTNGHILYSLPTETVSTQLGSQEVVSPVSGSSTLEYIPARRDGETIYIALDYVKRYTNFGYQAYTEPARVQIDTGSGAEKTVATINKDTAIRESGGIKSAIMEDLEKGQEVTVLEEMDEWSRVKSGDAIFGYVENKRLSDKSTVTAPVISDYVEPEYTTHMMDGKVNLTFHNVYSAQAAIDTLPQYMANTKSINVIAPTWYWITSENGDMTSFASTSYVQAAHNMGLKVWGVVNNFESQELTDHSSFLRTRETRSHLIDQLINESLATGVDGINVDLEQIDSSYGTSYVQFIRELSIACRANNLTMSVDDYPSYEFNKFYDVGEQGVFCDYVIIMGYDEHYQGSQEAGSVASISYVTEGITMALDDGVPKEKLINALPFYARVWTTNNGAVSSEAYGMQDIQNYIANHGMSVAWNAAAGQNYAETTENGALIQIWVEDAQSIQEKLNVMTSTGCAGVASWKLSFETPEIWDIISAWMQS